jgi:hypothetical protein
MPVVSIYLDHKIADHVSTFTTTLLYGPIIPNDIFKNIYDNDILLFEYSYNDFEPGVMDQLVRSFNQENRTAFTTTNYKKIGTFVFTKLIQNDIPEREQPWLDFKPFLNTCNTNPTLLEIIGDDEVIQFDYFLFTLPEGCIEKDDCSINMSAISNYKSVLGFYKNVNAKKQAVRISDKINHYRCPQSWYKTEMICE